MICLAIKNYSAGFGYSRRINFETEGAGDEASEFPEALEEQLLLSMFPRYKPPEGNLTVHFPFIYRSFPVHFSSISRPFTA